MAMVTIVLTNNCFDQEMAKAGIECEAEDCLFLLDLLIEIIQQAVEKEPIYFRAIRKKC
jgi:hypothetical protein